MYQCGLPKEMALELFKPFVMKELVLKGLAHNIKSAKRKVERVSPEVWDVLEAYGIQEHVLIDLTMIGDFSYYTGMTFEGYASHLGFPVCSGGRYDNLLAQFGRPAHATGFALKTTRILEVVEDAAEQRERTLVAYASTRRQEALVKASQLREQGAIVVTALVSTAELEELLAADLERHLSKGELVYRGKSYDKLVPFDDGKEGLA